jgi:hypothetical protein
MKTLNQSKKPDDFDSKGGDKKSRKQLKQGSKTFLSSLLLSIFQQT